MMVERREEQRVRNKAEMLSDSLEDDTLLTVLYQSETECDGREMGRLKPALSCEKGVNMKMKKSALTLKWLE